MSVHKSRPRPPFLKWAVAGMLAAQGDWVFQGSEKEANNFLVEHYFRTYPHHRYGDY